MSKGGQKPDGKGACSFAHRDQAHGIQGGEGAGDLEGPTEILGNVANTLVLSSLAH